MRKAALFGVRPFSAALKASNRLDRATFFNPGQARDKNSNRSCQIHPINGCRPFLATCDRKAALKRRTPKKYRTRRAYASTLAFIHPSSLLVDRDPDRPHERHGVALFHDAGAHAVVEDHRVVFEMILKVDIARQRGMHFHQTCERQIVSGQ